MESVLVCEAWSQCAGLGWGEASGEVESRESRSGQGEGAVTLMELRFHEGEL